MADGVEEVEEPPAKKRKVRAEAKGESGRRTTRSQSRRTVDTPQSTPVVEIEDSEYEESEEEVQPVQQRREKSNSEPADGLVACPMCSRRMKEEVVFTHLDICKGPLESAGGSGRIASRYRSQASLHASLQETNRPIVHPKSPNQQHTYSRHKRHLFPAFQQ